MAEETTRPIGGQSAPQEKSVPVGAPKEEPHPGNDPPELLYANHDGTQIVEAGSPESAFQINPDDPGPYADLISQPKSKKK